eukprot:c27725_g1_i1.p1 GENE.c27725_g1_i1~~c27725_g1_i1.p1  ORF type:complete len:170 (+),score=27.50 c27725_g1_i1:57-566(+)
MSTPRPPPYALDNNVFLPGFTIAILAVHILLYRPWKLEMPLRVLLPVVHVVLFASNLWSVLAVCQANGGSTSLAAFVWQLSMAIGPIHTYFFFREKDYVTALLVIQIMVVAAFAAAGLGLWETDVTTSLPMFGAAAWCSFVMVTNAQRAAKQRAAGGASGGRAGKKVKK